MSTKENKLLIAKTILKMTLQNGQEPEVSEIEDYTGLSSIVVIRNVGKDYPKELMITKIERTVLDSYEENRSLKATSEATGIPYYDVSSTLARLKRKGIKVPDGKRKGSENGKCNEISKSGSITYIEIVRDLLHKHAKGSKGEKLNLKGARGYLDENAANIAVLYLNRTCYRVTVREKDYRIVRRQV